VQQHYSEVGCFQHCLLVGVCLFVKTMTLEPFEIPSCNFYESKICLVAQTSSKMAAFDAERQRVCDILVLILSILIIVLMLYFQK